MGLQHTVAVTYGFEIPHTTDLDHLDQVIGDGPDLVPDRVGHIVIGDWDRLLLVTRYTRIKENDLLRLGTDTLAQPDELAAWEAALHDVAVRLGHTDHPAPAWLVLHNHR
jgi:hypothetical protein